ncbi:MAG: MFS transporter [Spirochaetes bacterium]|nr:MFS transporter [Spirochaetota bacterium]
MSVPGPSRDPLLWRFSLYGFLKNQQYYEPFFILVLQSKGLTFFQIGLLYSFREVWVNVMGIPAGFLSDLYGRRLSLVVCFAAYILSFVGFALAGSLPLLFVAMFFFAVGESFRSGTHKAMIFQHLRDHGREGEKAAVYGFTRSWSKIGSAVSSVASGLLMVATGAYAHIFLYTIPPYLANALNVGLYPKVLEGERKREPFHLPTVVRTMGRETLSCLRQAPLRGLFIESAALQAVAKTVRDYVQPLMVLALAAPMAVGPLSGLDPTKRAAVLLALIYAALNIAAAIGSRQSHRFQALERRRLPFLWIAVSLVALLLTFGLAARATLPWTASLAVGGFILLILLENLWRPLFLDRLDDVSDSKFGAAVLSVEAQFQSLGVMVFAPLVGRVVDQAGLSGAGVCALVVALLVGSYSFYRRRAPASAKY